ncbi:MAG: hypothetical protein LBD01_02800 [Puniceicoccales bacterium]|jgi:hypothetical protein|nr:hypothetical protein [Puniceicoccales bacterium]
MNNSSNKLIKLLGASTTIGVIGFCCATGLCAWRKAEVRSIGREISKIEAECTRLNRDNTHLLRYVVDFTNPVKLRNRLLLEAADLDIPQKRQTVRARFRPRQVPVAAPPHNGLDALVSNSVLARASTLQENEAGASNTR